MMIVGQISNKKEAHTIQKIVKRSVVGNRAKKLGRRSKDIV
ncbi:MAG: hypothetical protein V5A68_01745 [Candidatus Thermoplasmatota archaeon]